MSDPEHDEDRPEAAPGPGESSDATPPQPGWGDPGSTTGSQPGWGDPLPRADTGHQAATPPSYPPPPHQYPGPPSHPGGYGYPSVYQPLPPKHPNATTALVLGIVSVVGGLLCCLPVVIGPFGWYFGAKTLREIREAPGRYTGEAEARIGMIFGIVGSIIAACLVLLIASVIALEIAAA